MAVSHGTTHSFSRRNSHHENDYYSHGSLFYFSVCRYLYVYCVVRLDNRCDSKMFLFYFYLYTTKNAHLAFIHKMSLA